MNRKILFLLTVVCVVLTGCSGFGPGKDFDKMREKLLKLKAYTCDVEMNVTNNKSTMRYKLKHSFKSPDRYRIEVLEPEELQGQITIHNGKVTYIYHPKIDQYLITESFSESADCQAFIGSFINHMRDKENLEIRREKVENKAYYEIELQVPEPSEYMSTEKIWIDAAEAVPAKAEIYDKTGKVTVSVQYTNFVYNPELNEGDFEIPKIN